MALQKEKKKNNEYRSKLKERCSKTKLCEHTSWDTMYRFSSIAYLLGNNRCPEFSSVKIKRVHHFFPAAVFSLATAMTPINTFYDFHTEFIERYKNCFFFGCTLLSTLFCFVLLVYRADAYFYTYIIHSMPHTVSRAICAYIMYYNWLYTGWFTKVVH